MNYSFDLAELATHRCLDVLAVPLRICDITRFIENNCGMNMLFESEVFHKCHGNKEGFKELLKKSKILSKDRSNKQEAQITKGYTAK